MKMAKTSNCPCIIRIDKNLFSSVNLALLCDAFSQFFTYLWFLIFDKFFFQVIVRHLSKFITNRIDADLEKRTLFISLTVPMVKIRGNYRVNGQVFVFQISGNGPFQVSFS